MKKKYDEDKLSLNLLVKIAQTLEVKAGKMVDEMVEDAERVL